MAGKAQLPKTSVDEIVKANKERKKQFGRERSLFAGIPQLLAVNGIGVSHKSTGGIISTIQGLPTAGGPMIGPIAFHPRAAILSDGVLDIGKTTTAFSSRVIVLGQANPDNLVRISNPSHAGQILFLQAVSTTAIVLKHETDEGSAVGNIYMPSGSDYTVAGKEIVLLQWDTINQAQGESTEYGQWTLVATSGGGLTNPMTEDLDMGNNDITNTNNYYLTRSDGTARMAILGGSGSTTQVLFDAVSGTDIRFTEGLVDKFTMTLSGATDVADLKMDLDMNDKMVTGVTLLGITDGSGTASGSISGDTEDTIYASASGKKHIFKDVTTPRFEIRSGYIDVKDNVITGDSDQPLMITGGEDSSASRDKVVKLDADLHMNTYDIYEACRVIFESGGILAVGSTDYGIDVQSDSMNFHAPALKEFIFKITPTVAGAPNATGDMITVAGAINTSNGTGSNIILSPSPQEVGSVTQSITLKPYNNTDGYLGSGTDRWQNILGNEVTIYGSAAGIGSSKAGLIMEANAAVLTNDGEFISALNAGENLGSTTNYWKETYIKGIQFKSGYSFAPSTNGEMRLDGSDVKVYTGGGVKNLSDIGSGGSSGADTDLGNLTTTSINQDLLPSSSTSKSLGSSTKRWKYLYVDVQATVDYLYLATGGAGIDMNDQDILDCREIVINDVLASRGISSFGTSASDLIECYGKVGFRNNFTNGSVSTPATAAGYVTVRIDGTTNRKIYYY